jgi:hypothetical protein
MINISMGKVFQRGSNQVGDGWMRQIKVSAMSLHFNSIVVLTIAANSNNKKNFLDKQNENSNHFFTSKP